MIILKYIVSIIVIPLFLLITILTMPFFLLSWLIGAIYYVFKRRANN